MDSKGILGSMNIVSLITTGYKETFSFDPDLNLIRIQSGQWLQ
jgi:hypothetical protein